ncbi:MAG: ABC transporter ATP-binding protein [Eubacteriales bacterium]
MKRLLHYLKPYAGMMGLGFLIKAVGTVMDLFLPWILSMIIDDIIPKKVIKEIVFWGVVMLICAEIAVTFNIIANRMASRVAGNCTKSIRHDLYAHISYLDAAQVDRLTISSLESRLTVDTYNVHQMVGMIQRLGVRAPLLLLGGITVTFLLDVHLTLVLLCTLPFIILSVTIITKKGVPLYIKLQQAIDNMTRVVRENATGVRVIKALRKTEYEKSRFDSVNRDAIQKEKVAGITMAATNPLVNLFLNFGLTAVVVAGAYFVYHGESTTGKIIAFMSYFTIISNALISISRMFTVSSKGLAGMARIDGVLKEEPTLWVGEENGAESTAKHTATDSDHQTVTDLPSDRPHLTFENVSYSYDKDAKSRTLENITFELCHGQTLGIIGATGSGKSTLISLLLRIYDTDSGKITIDGRDIRQIPTKKLRELVGIVFQNDFIFADTVSANVRFGREMSDEQVIAALKIAQAGFVFDYPDTIEHPLDIKGANLSGGQRQRLLIARAVAANPDLLILDDASSALDYRTDATLRAELSRHFRNTTKLIVAQRVSSILHADKILVLDSGRMIGFGSHDQLMESCPVYREIYEVQMGGGFTID